MLKNERINHPESDLIYSTTVGTSLGFIAGALVGVVQLIYVPELATWVHGAIILLICALGGAMYGAIAGGGGVFSRGENRVEKTRVAARLKEIHF